MSALTLTLQMNEKNPDSWCTFQWTRGFDGEGGWFTRTHMGNTPPNCRVHTELDRELTVLAKARGMEEQHNFARNVPKPVKEKTVRTRGPRKPKAPTLMGGFNPFAGS